LGDFPEDSPFDQLLDNEEGGEVEGVPGLVAEHYNTIVVAEHHHYRLPVGFKNPGFNRDAAPFKGPECDTAGQLIARSSFLPKAKPFRVRRQRPIS
jgi:hypothetical protein